MPPSPPPSATAAAAPARPGPPSPAHRQLDEIAAQLDQGQRASARAALAPLLQALDRTGCLDEQLVAHALMGRLLDKSGAARQASAEFERVAQLWQDPAVAVQHVGAASESETTRYLRLGRALNAVGEAMFRQAEQTRLSTVEPLRFPAYAGARAAPGPRKPLGQMTAAERDRELARRKAESESVRKHIQGPVRLWVERKQRAIEDAEKAYAKVVDLQPVPPPLWVVASASRVGQMWADFSDDFADAPVPAWMSSDPDVLTMYQRLLGEATEPQRARAQAAFETCQHLAERYRIDNTYVQQCKSWLDSHPSP